MLSLTALSSELGEGYSQQAVAKFVARHPSQQLANYVGASNDDSSYVEQCWTEAVTMVAQFVGARAVPEEIIIRSAIEVGSELYHRRNAPNGIAQFSTIDGSAIRVARDPMIGAYPILSRFVGPGIA